jgi:hypothetical protein
MLTYSGLGQNWITTRDALHAVVLSLLSSFRATYLSERNMLVYGVRVSVPPHNTRYFGRFIITHSIECTNESICLFYKFTDTTWFGLMAIFVCIHVKLQIYYVFADYIV